MVGVSEVVLGVFLWVSMQVFLVRRLFLVEGRRDG
jgi:hypothetical protein